MVDHAALRWGPRGLCLLLCASLPGCWAYPTVGMTPPVQLNAPPDEVKAFRVDVSACHSSAELYRPPTYLFSPLSLPKSDQIGPEMNAALNYGWYVNFLIATYYRYTNHTMLLRLYRPGYETIEIQPWDWPHELVWREAKDLAARERALDQLLATELPDGYVRPKASSLLNRSLVFGSFAPGSRSPEHRDFLLFAADAYDQLGAQASSDRVTKTRLKAKADGLRRRADASDADGTNPPSYQWSAGQIDPSEPQGQGMPVLPGGTVVSAPYNGTGSEPGASAAGGPTRR